MLKLFNEVVYTFVIFFQEKSILSDQRYQNYNYLQLIICNLSVINKLI